MQKAFVYPPTARRRADDSAHIPISTHCYSLESPYSIPRPCTQFQTPIHKTSTYSNMQSHLRVSPTFPPPDPRLNVILTQQTHYLQATDPSHTHQCSPLSGATHHCPTVDISKYYNPNVLELSVTTLDVLLSHTFIPPSHSNPFTSLFIT